jgi:hypothetical protein
MVGIMLMPGIVLAQSGAGSIQGTVMDSTGAVIPSAAIQVKNIATGVVSNTTSNGVGFYQVPSLFVGTYSLRVSSQGMSTYETSIELQVGQTAMINPILSPGTVSVEVLVNAGQIQLTSPDSGTLSSTLENERIQQLPMDGRNIQGLIGLAAPGMEGASGKVNGVAVEGMTYTVDGVATRADNDGSSTSVTLLPDPDSVQEVRMETSNSSARYSTPATATLSTKSGTNKLHGTFFETARNNAFGVARARQDAVGVAAPKYIRNEFGASAGGPITLPGIFNGKDRSFWFFAYERYSLAQNTTTLANVPTDAMRNGDFSGLVSNNNLQVQYDPATTKANAACAVPVAGATYTTKGTENNPYCRTPYYGTSYTGTANTINVISKSLMSPLASIYYKLLPEPTTADNPSQKPNVTAVTPNLMITTDYAFRLDHHFSEKDNTYLTFLKRENQSNTSNTMANLPVSQTGINIPAGAAFGYSNKPQITFVAALGHTHVFSPTFYSETSLNAQWFHSKGIPGVAADQDFESMLGLPNNFGQPGMPTICGGKAGCFQGIVSSQNANNSAAQRSFTLVENLSKTNGKHQVQFGGEFRQSVNSNKPVGVPDAIPYGAIATGLYQPSTKANYKPYGNTGFADVSMYLGLPNNYTINLQAPHVVYHVTTAAAYIQDNYHITRNLIANIGLRWEGRPGLLTVGGITDTFDLKNDALVLGAPISDLIAKGLTTQAIINNDQQIGVKFETPQQAGMPDKLMRDYYLNFLPRVGLSYQTKWGTVVRGAYGRYLQINPLQDFVNHPQQNNPFTASYTASYNTADQAVDALPNEYIRYNGPVKFPVTGLNSANVVNSASQTAILPGITGFYSDPNWAPTAVTTTNFTIEQPVKGHSIVRASYVWTHSTNLDTTLMFNAAPSAYQWYMATGKALPTGGASVIGTAQQNTYAATAEGPYDQTTWGTVATASGGNSWHTRSGWSNYNALQATYQRLYHHGYAYQLTYVFGKTMRAGGNSNDGNNLVFPFANYPGVLGTKGVMSLLPGSAQPFVGATAPGIPAYTPNWGMSHDLLKYAEYQMDNGTPTMHIRFNWVVDLPVGHGRKFFGGSRRWLDEIIGGYQLAGAADIKSNLIQPNSGNWGATSKLKIYKHNAPIVNCTSGVCYKQYLWFNGYQSPLTVSGQNCTNNCISGMPSDYTPVQSPMITDPTSPNFGQNMVNVKLLDGTTQAVAYDGGPAGGSYLEKTYIHGPVNWPINASLFKVFPITERVRLRVNLDAFNVFNMPGEQDPDGTGVQAYLKNAASNPARTLQITARLSF